MYGVYWYRKDKQLNKKPSEEILEGHNFIIRVGLFVFPRASTSGVLRYASYYSIIVATRPEPTVLPPSRFLVMIYIIANGDKYALFINSLTVFDSIISGFQLF